MVSSPHSCNPSPPSFRALNSPHLTRGCVIMITSRQIVIQSVAKDLKSVGVCIQILPPFGRLNDNMISFDMSIKKGGYSFTTIRLSCKKLRFHNPSSCRIFKSLTFLFNFPFHAIIYVKVNYK